VNPAHFRLATKPGSLPASVLPSCDLRPLDSLLFAEFTPEALNRFFVTDRLQCLGIFADAQPENPLDLFEQTRLKHPNTARVDPCSKQFTMRGESHLMNAETLERSDRVCLKDFSDGLPGLHAYFDRPDYLIRVVRMDSFGRPAIQAAKQSVQAFRTACCKSLPQRLVSHWSFRKAVQKRPEVKPRSTNHNRQASPAGDVGNNLARRTCVIAGCKDLVGVKQINKMVGNASALIRRDLGCSYVEVLIELHRIAVDDLSTELLCDAQGQIAFA
jgi:hypothetical protein